MSHIRDNLTGSDDSRSPNQPVVNSAPTITQVNPALFPSHTRVDQFELQSGTDVNEKENYIIQYTPTAASKSSAMHTGRLSLTLATILTTSSNSCLAFEGSGSESTLSDNTETTGTIQDSIGASSGSNNLAGTTLEAALNGPVPAADGEDLHTFRRHTYTDKVLLILRFQRLDPLFAATNQRTDS